VIASVTNAGARVAEAQDALAKAKGQYDGLEALILATRRLVTQRDQLFRKQRTVETLRRDQRAIEALRDLSDLSTDAIWLEQVSFSEASPADAAKSSAKPKPQRGARSGSAFHIPDPVGQGGGETQRSQPVTMTVSGFALSQQELAEFLGRMTAHDRFAGVELRWSSRTGFLDGQAVKFVVAGAYR